MEFGINKKKMENSSFDIPIVLFTFKRSDKTLEVLDRIAEVKPKKLYILSDEGRNEEEQKIVKKLRYDIEQKITWDCELVKNYATENRGVYENIGLGAIWVLEREDSAIFLEDDNLPALSFFSFCREMLIKYKEEEKVLWICGTNYMHEYLPKDEASYMFTSNMLPCGWASWSKKFIKYYDGELKRWDDLDIRKKLKKEKKYYSPLLTQDFNNWNRERNRIKRGLKPDSWDYQMAFSLKANNLLGIAPKYNLIENIGVDFDSIHMGNSFSLEMTRRFCGIPTKELEFPLKHPKIVNIDKDFDIKIAKIITLPKIDRIKGDLALFLKNILGMNEEDSITLRAKNFFKIKVRLL